jgi:hypothetical protein
MTAAGDALAARGDKQAAYEAYEKTRDRCFAHPDVRRRLFLLRAPVPGASQPRPAASEAWLNLVVDNQLGKGVLLVWFAPYLDGEPVQEVAPTRLPAGAHELHLELYLATVEGDRARDPVRIDARQSIVLPAALIGHGAVAGGARITLQDKGGAAALGERVSVTITAIPFRPQEAPPTLGNSIALAAPESAKKSPKMVPPNVGSNQLVSGAVSVARLRPEIFEKKSFWTMLKVCVTDTGSVSQVKLIRNDDGAALGDLNLADTVQLTSVIGQWRYKPYLIKGLPVPICYPLRLVVPPQK